MFEMINVNLPVPSISTLCERLKTLGIDTPEFKNNAPRIDGLFAIAIDSTGLKQFGRDEWHQEKHRVKSKASWRKAHFGVGDDHIIYAAKMTDKNTWDQEVVDGLVAQIDVPIEHVSGDKAYDEKHVYETLMEAFPEANIIIPPKNDTTDNENHHEKRLEHVREIAETNQLSWQEKHQYGKRNVSELAMQRYK